MKKKTGIFGGSFNPIHVGHIALARQLLKCAGLQEVWFVVSPQNPWKTEQELLDDESRLNMVRIALRDEENLLASDYEFHLQRPSYTLNTLRHLSKDYPDREFVLLIGGDNWKQFDKWYGYQEILSNYSIVVYPRRGEHAEEKKLPENVSVVDTPLLDISSTEIRNRILQGQSIHDLVPKSIESLVLRNYQK